MAWSEWSNATKEALDNAIVNHIRIASGELLDADDGF